jgi:hypothetical protein
MYCIVAYLPGCANIRTTGPIHSRLDWPQGRTMQDVPGVPGLERIGGAVERR